MTNVVKMLSKVIKEEEKERKELNKESITTVPADEVVALMQEYLQEKYPKNK